MSSCFSSQKLVPVEAARERLVDAMQPVTGTERAALRQAVGRIVAEPVASTIDLPLCDNSAMDGYAVRYADLEYCESLELIGKSFAGKPFEGTVAPGTCVRIMTGASVPAGADTVVMQEQAESTQGKVRITGQVHPGDHIRRRGEDIREGDTLVASGSRITIPHIALMAAAGIDSVTVRRRPKIALFSTGDELQQPGEPLAAGEIYDSNRVALAAALSEMDMEILDLGALPDSQTLIEHALEQAAREADAIITSGGVSVGDADYTRKVLEEKGEISFWKVAIKPGKPFAFGHLNRKPFFGVPGNPVSALVTFYQLVVPALNLLKGIAEPPPASFQAKLLKPINKKPGRTDYQRGLFRNDDEQGLVVEPVGIQGSHILSGFATANCFIVLESPAESADPGDVVNIEPFRSPLAR